MNFLYSVEASVPEYAYVGFVNTPHDLSYYNKNDEITARLPEMDRNKNILLFNEDEVKSEGAYTGAQQKKGRFPEDFINFYNEETFEKICVDEAVCTSINDSQLEQILLRLKKHGTFSAPHHLFPVPDSKIFGPTSEIKRLESQLRGFVEKHNHKYEFNTESTKKFNGFISFSKLKYDYDQSKDPRKLKVEYSEKDSFFITFTKTAGDTASKKRKSRHLEDDHNNDIKENEPQFRKYRN